jgi:hypothetical protein
MAGPLPKLIIAAKYSQGCQGANDTRPNPAFLGCKFCSREMTSDIQYISSFNVASLIGGIVQRAV